MLRTKETHFFLFESLPSFPDRYFPKQFKCICRVFFARNFLSSTSTYFLFLLIPLLLLLNLLLHLFFLLLFCTYLQFTFPPSSFIIPNMPLINCLIYYFFHFTFYLRKTRQERKEKHDEFLLIYICTLWFMFFNFEKLWEREGERASRKKEANRSAPHKFAFAMHNFSKRNTNVK